MIQDLEGATPEPARGRHVLVLSGAVAAVSLALFVALILPPSHEDTPPLAASPTPSASSGPVMTIVSGPTVFFGSGSPYFQSGPLPTTRVDERIVRCVAGSGSNPPYLLVFDRSGRLIAAYSDGRGEQSVPTLPETYLGSGWLAVPCIASEVPAQRIDRAR